MSTASMSIERQNLRLIRAQVLASRIMHQLDQCICNCGVKNHYRKAYDEIMEVLYAEGVEALTDYDRQQAGLPPRGPDGWTMEEIIELDKKRMEVLTRPYPPLVMLDPKTLQPKEVK
jgi:hypothetical protein